MNTDLEIKLKVIEIKLDIALEILMKFLEKKESLKIKELLNNMEEVAYEKRMGDDL